MHNPSEEFERRRLEWRKSMSVRLKDESSIDELETHLREAFEQALASGDEVEAAWRTATGELGEAHVLAREFSKLSAPSVIDRRALQILCSVGLVMTLLFVIIGSNRAWSGAGDSLLAFHLGSLTTGYCVALTLAATGGYLASRRLARAHWSSVGMHPRDVGDLARLLSRGYTLVAVTVAIGLGLGSVWASNTHGAAWSFDPREVGAAGLLCYHAFFAWRIRRKPANTEALLAVASFGGAITLLAWFGAHLLVDPDPASSGVLPLFVLAVLTSVFLAGSCARRTLSESSGLES